MFHKTDTWNKHGYFYVTEVAPKPLGRHTVDEIYQIDKKLRKLGFGVDASLEINLRRMTDNTLVAIDFGAYSWGNNYNNGKREWN